MKQIAVCELAKTLASVDLSQEVKILAVNTDNKCSFNNRTKTSVEKLVRYSLKSLELVYTLITTIKESRQLLVQENQRT